MKEQFNDDINSLTGARSSDSGGKPTPIDESAPDAFDRNWNWEFEVRPLGLLKRPNALSPWAPMIWRR